ncbi:MAG: SDR family NAD(P)-dependent oxidoreductase [Saprospiraceae bacterium]
MQKAFKDKVIWITGASSGIGEALAYELSKAGAYLVLSSRKITELERVRSNCSVPDKTLVLPCDVTDFDNTDTIAQKAIDFQGRIDLLINNAGISQRALAQETKLAVDQQIMNVNYFGNIAITKAILPHMIERQQGHIVVMSSVLGKMGVPYRSAYCASKHALQGFYDALRAEIHKENIDVTTICPGYVRTNVTKNALKGDGTPNNFVASSTASGYNPKEFAEMALRAIAKRRKEVYFAKRELRGVYLNRLSPNIFFRLIRNYKLK